MCSASNSIEWMGISASILRTVAGSFCRFFEITGNRRINEGGDVNSLFLQNLLAHELVIWANLNAHLWFGRLRIHIYDIWRAINEESEILMKTIEFQTCFEVLRNGFLSETLRHNFWQKNVARNFSTNTIQRNLDNISDYHFSMKQILLQ